MKAGKHIGVLVIGQTPRPDLTASLARIGTTCILDVRGALDGLDAADLPRDAGGAYPLVTRLRDGTRVTVAADFLTPRLQAALDGLEQDGAIAHILLCAGPFPALTSTRPLLRPFALAAQMLRQFGMTRVGVVVPTDAQRGPAADKWRAVGMTPVVWSMATKPVGDSPAAWLAPLLATHAGLSAVVFDYVGYPRDVVGEVRARVRLPVLELGHLAVAALEALLPGVVPSAYTIPGGTCAGT